jgi:hypothetical protein
MKFYPVISRVSMELQSNVSKTISASIIRVDVTNNMTAHYTCRGYRYNGQSCHSSNMPWQWRQRQCPKRWIVTTYIHGWSPVKTSLLKLSPFSSCCSVTRSLPHHFSNPNMTQDHTDPHKIITDAPTILCHSIWKQTTQYCNWGRKRLVRFQDLTAASMKMVVFWANISLMMEAVSSFETSASFYQTTWHNIREDRHLQERAYHAWHSLLHQHESESRNNALYNARSSYW